MNNAIKSAILKYYFQDESPLIIGEKQVSLFRAYQNIGVRKCAEMKGITSVLNMGALVNEGDKEGNTYASYFNGVDFYALDRARFIDSPFQLNMDLHDLSKLNRMFDLVLCMSVLEHVENPFEVAKELVSVVSPGGYLYIAVPFFYPEHKDGKKRWSDYWRFTDDALRILFKDMKEVWIDRMPSPVAAVKDRPLYWNNPELTAAGFTALFQKAEYNDKTLD